MIVKVESSFSAGQSSCYYQCVEVARPLRGARVKVPAGVPSDGMAASLPVAP